MTNDHANTIGDLEDRIDQLEARVAELEASEENRRKFLDAIKALYRHEDDDAIDRAIEKELFVAEGGDSDE